MKEESNIVSKLSKIIELMAEKRRKFTSRSLRRQSSWKAFKWKSLNWKSLNFRSVKWKSPRVIGGLLMIAVAVSAAAVYLSTTIPADYLVLNGQRLGLVQSQAVGQTLINNILKQRGKNIGQVALTHDQIRFEGARVSEATMLHQRLSETALAQKMTSYVDGWELLADGKVVAVLPSQSDVNKVLQEYQAYYALPSSTNKVTAVSFAEKVTSQATEAQPENVMLPDQALQTLERGQIVTKNYVVKPDDSWWLIARKNDMLTKEVLAANPGATESTKLKPGQQIKLATVIPYLTVLSKGEVTATEKIPYAVASNMDYSLPAGTSVVQQAGKDGSETVTYSYEKKNGTYVSKHLVRKTVTTPAVTQIVSAGPSWAPITVASASRGSGHVSGLIWPLRGTISSPYGWRDIGFHTGIDIEGPEGTPYVAAASGTVVSAGWDGGYGQMILIDHGNGVMTRYAHSSKLLVSVGEHVVQGQTIGLVGATGNATGPHLHFEVISNGSTLNPINYLP